MIECTAFHKMSLILSSHHIRSSKQRTPCRSCSKQLHTWLAPCSTRAIKPRCEQACSTWRQVHVENLLLLETNVDDSSPQVLAYTMEELLLAGGLDVWSAPVYRRKGALARHFVFFARRAMPRTLCTYYSRSVNNSSPNNGILT